MSKNHSSNISSCSSLMHVQNAQTNVTTVAQQHHTGSLAFSSATIAARSAYVFHLARTATRKSAHATTT